MPYQDNRQPIGMPLVLYGRGHQRVLTPIQVDTTSAQMFTIDLRGGGGVLSIVTLLGDRSTPGVQTYSQNADLSQATSGPFTFAGGERLYCLATGSLIQLSGTVTSGAVNVVYTPWTLIPPGAAAPVNIVQGGAFLNPLNPLPTTGGGF